MSPVLSINVLDDFLPALVLEIDIDIRRFIPLATHKAFEEHIDSIRIDGRHSEREADGTVGRSTTSLTENASTTREGDDVVHCEKVWRVTQVINDGELVLKLTCNFRWNTARIAFARTFPDELAQVVHRGHPCWNDLVWILISQLVEREPRRTFKKTTCRLDRFRFIRKSQEHLARTLQSLFSIA